MSHFKQKVLALAMAAAMTLSLSSVAFAAEFSDMPTGWSRAAMEAAVENGLLSGTDGKLNPGGKLQRSEMATIMVRAFGATVAADLSGYTDVPAGAWYADAVAKAAQMGILNGSGNSMAPTREIQRQEAFLILARALKLENGTAADLAAFSDASAVASWALGGVAAMVKAGYVNGSDGKLDPTGTITREQFAQVMYNAFATYITEAGEVTELPEGNVVVRVGGVTLKDVTVKGDLIIGDGVGEGDVILDNVTVDGRMVVRGGGVNSIRIINSTVTNVIITKTFGAVRVVADTDSTVSVTVADTAVGATIEGAIQTLTVASTAPVTVNNASVTTVAVTAAKASLNMTGDTTVSTMTVTVTGVTVSTSADVTITTVNTTVNVVVTGDGEVGNVTGTGSVTDTPVTNPTPSDPSDPGNEEHTHTYIFYEDEDSFGCVGTCSCGDTMTVSHMDKISCEYCGWSRTPSAEDHEHVGDGRWFKGFDMGHFDFCTICGAQFWEAHTFDEGGVCTVCGYEKHEHTCAEGVYGKGEDVHWQSCTVCGVTMNREPHNLINDVCTVCGYEVHEHVWGAYQNDEHEHWHSCTICNTSIYENHVFGEDGACSVCGYKASTTPTHTHSTAPANGDEAWQNDATNHWYVCSVTGCDAPNEQRGVAAHDTAGTGGACSVCGYKASTTPTHTHVWADGVCTGANPPAGGCTCPDAANHANILTTEKCETCKAAGTKAGGSDEEHTLTKTSNNDGTHNVTCSVTNCDKGHVKTNETCDKNGTDGACSVCGYKAEDPCKNGHTPGSTYSDNGDGTHTYTCTVCNQPVTEDCDSSDTVTGEAATCTAPGREDGTKCSRCDGNVTQGAVIEATGHVDEDGDNKCDNCNADMSSGGGVEQDP